MAAFSIPSRTLRTICAAGFVAASVTLAQSQDVLREITRPIVLGILNVFRVFAEDRGEVMAIGHLEIPWTRDCAGINLLLIMLALAVWVNREEPSVRKFWLRIICMAPAALAANVLRVLTLIGYRMIAYPAVESPQTHYFIGFIWMVPFVTLVTPRVGRPVFHALVETLHAAAVIALLTPMTGMPNGDLITVAVVIALSQCRVRNHQSNWAILMNVLWVAVGAAIAMVNMESFWLPWLLCCPLLLNFRWLFSLAGVLVMLSTQSMFAMQSWAPYIGWTGIGLAIWQWFKNTPGSENAPSGDSDSSASWQRRAIALSAACCFLIPFLASTLLSIGQHRWSPPKTVESRALENHGFEVRLPGQSEQIALVCYGAEGNDRHHTIKVCLKYRGTELDAHPDQPSVYSDGQHWLREFFLLDSELVADYPAYLKSTFAPGSKPGVHLIFISPMESTTPEVFAASSAKLANDLYELSARP